MRGAGGWLRAKVLGTPVGESIGEYTDTVARMAELFPDVKRSTLHNYMRNAEDGSLGGLGEMRIRREGGGARLVVIRLGGSPSPDGDELAKLKADLEAASRRAEEAEKVKADVEAAMEQVRAELEKVKAGGMGASKITVNDRKAGVKVKVKGPLPAVFEKLVKLASIRQNTLMVGPSGCGKTFLAGKVAEALSLQFAFVSCSTGMSEGNVAGRLLPIEVGGRFVYVPAPFVRCYEEGGLFLFDEIDSADANMLTFVNAGLANGHISLPQRPDKPVALRHKDFVCFAAANTFGHGANRVYAGRNQLDGATLDRFRAGMVMVDYDATVEEALVDPEVLAWGRKIRGAIQRYELRRILSTRVLRDYTAQKHDLGWGRAAWEESYFLDWSADDRAKLDS